MKKLFHTVANVVQAKIRDNAEENVQNTFEKRNFPIVSVQKPPRIVLNLSKRSKISKFVKFYNNYSRNVGKTKKCKCFDGNETVKKNCVENEKL